MLCSGVPFKATDHQVLSLQLDSPFQPPFNLTSALTAPSYFFFFTNTPIQNGPNKFRRDYRHFFSYSFGVRHTNYKRC